VKATRPTRIAITTGAAVLCLGVAAPSVAYACTGDGTSPGAGQHREGRGALTDLQSAVEAATSTDQVRGIVKAALDALRQASQAFVMPCSRCRPAE